MRRLTAVRGRACRALTSSSSGPGLAGLSCAAELAERGARVFLAAKGMATTHWTHGGLDVAAPAGASTMRDGIATLATTRNHPYRTLAADADASVAAHLARTAAEGLAHTGSLDDALVPIPTAIGSHRPAAILPSAQAAALEPWAGDGLLLVGFSRYRDSWAPYAARNLERASWPGGPAAMRAIEVELPGLEGRQQHRAADPRPAVRGPGLARARALGHRRRAPRRARGASACRPSSASRGTPRCTRRPNRRLGSRVFEIASLPPSVPGLRLFEALRRRILRAGARIQIGFDVVDVERTGGRVIAIHTEAASRTLRIGADAFVLATGGIGGAGIRAAHDGALTERVFGLPVSAPSRELWFSDDPLRPHPLETAGIEVDANLAPAELENVRVIGSALAGMHYLDERCGDGVALASAHRAAASLASKRAVAA